MIYTIMAYPKAVPINAPTPMEAIEQYKAAHPEDKRDYLYTGAYHTFVIKSK